MLLNLKFLCDHAFELLWLVVTTNFIPLIIPSVIALTVHELGHIALATCFNLRVKKIGIKWRGPYIIREVGPALPSALTCLAGPLANLALAIACEHSYHLLWLVSLIIGASNLLPLPKMDGMKFLEAIQKL